MNFEDIQKNWHRQKAPHAAAITVNELSGHPLQVRVRKLQRKVIWTNVMMTLVLCLTGGGFLFILRGRFVPNTLWFDIGLGLMFGSILFSALAQWLKSVPWHNLRPDINSKAYIERALQSFRFRSTSIQWITPIQMMVSTIGLNLIFLDIFWNESLQLRVVMNLALAATMILVGGLSLYYSKLRYQEEYAPIIRELEELQQQLEEV